MSATINIEQAVLSDRIQQALDGQRLVTALFTTFSFDPGFFEQEVLRLFFDLPLTHLPALRLVQLEDALREVPVRPAVYYDPRALVISKFGASRLDIARHPVRMAACFHPKLVCALVEATEADENGRRTRKLIVACQSANLTESGWWQNLECSHLETIEEHSRTTLKDSLADFLRWLAPQSPTAPDGRPGVRTTQRFQGHAVGEILAFLDQTTAYQRKPLSPTEPRFIFSRPGHSITQMLDDEAGHKLEGLNLEIISPYFDAHGDCAPLVALMERFKPREVRVFLPQDDAGLPQVTPEMHASVRNLKNVSWGTLPKELRQNGPAGQGALRFVHAKVYRFFSGNPKREIWLLGSPNLTRSAHQPGGNMECAFLVERALDGQRRPGFLVEVEERIPKTFADAAKDPLEDADTALTRFALRFDWTTGIAQAQWESDAPPPTLLLSVAGVELGNITLKQPDTWLSLDSELARRIQEHLTATTLFTISDDTGQSAVFLVMEEGMSHKPSQLDRMSAADILRYWAMLTPEQRSVFLESRLHTLLLAASPDGEELPAAVLPPHADSLFDRMAGFFHAFHTLERGVSQAIDEQRPAQAVVRLFGQKYDSLGHLLDRMSQPDDPIQDSVDRYVIVLCARQSLRHLARSHSEFWAQHSRDAAALKHQVESLQTTLRSQLLAEGQEEEFLSWFEDEFLRRATREVTHEPD